MSDGVVAFLKVIKANTEKERRSRFFREASAYGSFLGQGVPKLLESNANYYANPQYELYIATEFVDGPTLREWREAQSNVSAETALKITLSLLRIIEEYHSQGFVHRDVKPENIILRDSETGNVAVLDFGLAYHEMPDLEFTTEHWQEIGNRFIRLPELSSGSLLKQDPRSDLTFAAGILFYLLSGQHPDLLQDADGKLPHQREIFSKLLKEQHFKSFSRFASFFDRAFALRINDRYNSASEMLAAMDKIMSSDQVLTPDEEDLSAIMELVNSGAEERQRAAIQRFNNAIGKVQTSFNEIMSQFKGSFVGAQTAMNVSGSSGTNTLYVSRLGSSDRILAMAYVVRDVGDEMIVEIADEPVYRTSLDNPTYGFDLEQAIRRWLLPRIRDAIASRS